MKNVPDKALKSGQKGQKIFDYFCRDFKKAIRCNTKESY